jgi:hypothetical protein
MCRLEVLRSAGFKYRVLGIPSALNFVEGAWIRESADLMPSADWEVASPVAGRPAAPGLQHADHWFASVDMSKATDGLHHDAVEEIIDALCEAGLIRTSDKSFALSSLGVAPLHEWEFSTTEGGEDSFLWRRGSPMGTPLSFTVLSWASAWASGAFRNARVRGDDCVGSDPDRRNLVLSLKEYEIALRCIGCELSRPKTFISQGAFTFCETIGLPRRSPRNPTVKVGVFAVPACPAPGGARPLVATPGVSRRHGCRQERVARCLSPWVCKSSKLHLPVELGGLGYTSRGLRASKSTRQRLAAAVSRGFDPLLLPACKGTYRGEGLFPRRLEQSRVSTRGGRKLRDTFCKKYVPKARPEENHVKVPLRTFTALLEERVANLLTLNECEPCVVDVGRRPARTRPQPFKNGKRAWWSRCKPLSVQHGIKSLLRLAHVLRERPIWVEETFVTDIPVGTPMGRKLIRATVMAH